MQPTPSLERSLRRAVLGLAVAWGALWAASSPAQVPDALRLPKIGLISGFADEAGFRGSPNGKGLVNGLREQGLIEGRDYTFALRFTAGHPDRYEVMAQDLVKLPVQVLTVPVCGTPVDAARRATSSIPIVVLTCNDDLVDLGIVKSFNHPGGNLTGLSKLTPELAPKRLQLLLQVVPASRRVGVLWNPAYSAFKSDWRELRSAAQKLGVTLVPVEFRSGDDIGPAFDSMAQQSPDAMMMFSDALAYVYATRVARLAGDHRLPTMFAFREVPDAGGLMSYGPSIPDMWRQAGKHIARILRGERAGDLPIEQPTRFELVINQKAARALGLSVPQELLLRADDVIE
jgi:putative ABC transport system substrate-binding protein